MTQPASKAQRKLVNDLIDAGAGHELNFGENPMTVSEADAFIKANTTIYNKLQKDRGLYRMCRDIEHRGGTPDQYNIPNH